MSTELFVGAPITQSQQPTPEAIRQQVRESIEQARADAARARLEARKALTQNPDGGSGGNLQVPLPPVPPVPGAPLPNGDRVFVPPDGRTIILHPDGTVDVQGGAGEEPIMVVPQDGPFGPFGPGGPHIPVEAVVISIAFFVMIVLVAVGIPIARAFGRRIDKRSAAMPELANVGQRLDRIEQAIETVAIEVERISEGQRYSSRLMTEMKQAQRIPAGESDR